MKKTKNAFTLAEVLITLTIIGIIAALTIPNLMQKHQEQELVSQYKKTVSVLSNAYKQAAIEKGPIEDLNFNGKNQEQNSKIVYDYISPYLKIKKYCGIGSNNKNCMYQGKYKALFSDNAFSASLGKDNDNSFPKAILADGSAFMLGTPTANGCSSNLLQSGHPFDKTCGQLYIDLNNKKGPNRFGVDLFILNMTDNGLYPSFALCEYKNSDNKNGLGCGEYILKHGNMDYLRRDISSR